MLAFAQRRKRKRNNNDGPPTVSPREVIVLLDCDLEEEQDDIILPQVLPVKIPDDDDDLRHQYLPNYPKRFRDSTSVPTSAKNNVRSTFKELGKETLHHNLALNFASELKDKIDLAHENFRMDLEQTHQVYAAKKTDRAKPKIGSTCNGAVRRKNYNDNEIEYIHSIMNLDGLGANDDTLFQDLTQKILRPLTFSPQKEIPTTLEEFDQITNKTGLPLPLQLKLFSILYSEEESPQLGGAAQVEGFLKTPLSRVLETGFQQLFAELLDGLASMDEFLHFDRDALDKSLERAHKFFRLILGAALKIIVDKIGLDLDAAKEKLVEIVKAFRHYKGSNGIGGLNEWSEATPLIVQSMLMIGGFGTHNYSHEQEWLSNAIEKKTPAGQNCYDTSSLEKEDKIGGVGNLKSGVEDCETKSGFRVFDNYEKFLKELFDLKEIEISKLKDLLDGREGWTPIVDFGRELLLYFYYNQEMGVASFLGIVPPLCYMIDINPKNLIFDPDHPIDAKNDLLKVMIDRAIFAEAIRLFIAWCLNGCKDETQNKLFSGNLVISQHDFLYKVLCLNGSRYAASLSFKQYVTPLEFNLWKKMYHGMAKGTHSIAMSRLARRRDKVLELVGEEDSRTRTADSMVYRKAAHVLCNPMWTDWDSAVAAVIEFLGKDVCPNTKHNRLKTFKGYIVDDNLKRTFQRIWDNQTANSGNTRNHVSVTDELVKNNDDWLEHILEELEKPENNGEFIFWIPGYKVEASGDIRKKQGKLLEIGDEIKWEGKLVKYTIRGKQQKVCFLEGFETCPITYETLKLRIVSKAKLDKDSNRKSGHVQSLKLCSDDFKLAKCKKGVGPFNVEETQRGWELMKITKKKKKKGNKNNNIK